MKVVKSDRAEVIGSVDYALVRRALLNDDLSKLNQIYEYFLRFDTQISSEIYKRRLSVIGLPYFFESVDKAQGEYLERLIKSKEFRDFLFDLTSAIAYGMAVFVKNYESINGIIVPKFELFNPLNLGLEKNRLYYTHMGTKHFLDSEKHFFIHTHSADIGGFARGSLMYKVVCIAVLKQMVINQNMKYYESLSVPPFIIKSDAVGGEAESAALIDMAVNLRSDGVALFAKDDVVELLGGASSKADFLSFITYCDESISKVIAGQILAGNAVNHGTQALGVIHSEIRADMIEFDAYMLGSSINKYLNLALGLNFANPKEFKFEFDTNSEKEEARLSEVYERLYRMGIEVPIKHLEKTFKIEGLLKKGGQVAPNSIQKNAKSKPNLPLDNIDADIANLDTKPVENEIKEQIIKLFKECKSYGEAYDRLVEIYDLDFETLDRLFVDSFTNAELMGLLE